MNCKRLASWTGKALLMLSISVPTTGARTPETLSLPGLSHPVTVIVDRAGIPHIYAQADSDAFAVLGYLHAHDRLLEMDFLRRRAHGELAELLGPTFFQADLLMRQLGIRRTAEATWRSDRLPSWVRSAIASYCRGVNARIKALDPADLEKRIGVKSYRFRPWEPVDALAFVKYMGWDQSGTDDDLWFAEVVDRMGPEAFQELWPLDRPFEIPIVPGLRRETGFVPPVRPLQMDAEIKRAFAEVRRQFDAQLRLFASDAAYGSNNWAVDGTLSATGQPLLASDPHLGFQLPSLWYVAHLHTPDLNVIGVTFPGIPFVIIGHNADVAWGITNMQADAVDYFIETLNPRDSTQYRHRGVWKPLYYVDETIQIAGAEPVQVRIPHTVHGPVLNRLGRPVALQWSGLDATFEIVTLALLNRARNVQDFRAALQYLDVPALNLLYADRHGTIAVAPHGRLPLRRRGYGRVPHDGASGEYDWAGWIPRDELPFSQNPAQHYLFSANQRPAAAGFPHYLGWMWDPAYRARRIDAVLRNAKGFTAADMRHLQLDVFSKPASVFVPLLLQAWQGVEIDSVTQIFLNILRDWRFDMRPDLAAPIVWTVWFELFRDAVWQDDFRALGVPQPEGSWGFTSNNRREPVLEVLEYICRYVPDSPWFDDRTTPQVETRDELMRYSFRAAMDTLRRLADQLGGNDPRRWQWGNTHRLHIASITGRPELGRQGLPISGGRFTVNPGGGLFGTDGGASWRMVVDFANLNESIGVYPGGQSEDPRSPHYDDLLALWASGRYVQLHFYDTPQEFPKTEIESTLRFSSGKP